MADLEKQILAKRETGFNGLLNYMEAKYGGGDEEVAEGDPKSRKKRINKGSAKEEKASPQKRKRYQ